MKKHLFLIAAILFGIGLTNIKAQKYAGIDSLKIIPKNPTANDSVKIISYTTFASGSCSLDSSSINLTGNTISVSAWNRKGIMNYVCNSTDTLTIGKLGSGDYELHYNLIDTYFKTSYDIDTIAFTVLLHSDVEHTENLNTKIEFYPNPATDNITVSSNNSIIQNIELFDLTGNCLFQNCVVKNKSFSFYAGDFPPGIYILKVETAKEKVARKIIINE